ncbi:MAG: aldo/keto reductase [Steroidobacteraceae bacterium]
MRSIGSPIRCIGAADVGPLGLGCMNLSHAYGTPPEPERAAELLRRALDLGVRHFDTAALYGFGRNETLIGEVLGADRHRIFLASKCGLTGVNGRRVLDNRPEMLKQTCHEALTRLHTDVIDLYYLHRYDRDVPLEDSIGALADLVREGSIRYIGLSEVSTDTLRRAHAMHPIAAVQNEYSLWTRNPEYGLLEECARIGAALVAFSPLTRGFLLGAIADPATLAAGDIRRGMPRFQEPNLSVNLQVAGAFQALAREVGYTPAQLALAWLLHKAPHIVPIFGTTSPTHLEENLAAARLVPDEDLMARLEALVTPLAIHGARYSAAAQRDIDTDEARSA